MLKWQQRDSHASVAQVHTHTLRVARYSLCNCFLSRYDSKMQKTFMRKAPFVFMLTGHVTRTCSKLQPLRLEDCVLPDRSSANGIQSSSCTSNAPPTGGLRKGAGGFGGGQQSKLYSPPPDGVDPPIRRRSEQQHERGAFAAGGDTTRVPAAQSAPPMSGLHRHGDARKICHADTSRQRVASVDRGNRRRPPLKPSAVLEHPA